MTRLLQEIIDYAGLFPPAKLTMTNAVARYAAASAGPEEWLLARFVCPVGDLSILADAIEERPNSPFFPVAAVAPASEDRAGWESVLESSVEAMNAFDRRMGDRAAIEAFEIRVPDTDGISRYLRDLAGFSGADVFVESPWGSGVADALAAIAETEWIYAKARTGGLDARSFPSPANLAGFLRTCVDLELPFKLTAGLHHALPRHDEATNAPMHGFLNVATAVVFALSDDLSGREIENLLTEADPNNWNFQPRAFEWRGRQAELAEIDEARDLFLSFGSCSIEDPFAELASFPQRS